MLKLEVKTSLPEDQAKARLKSFFQQGYGLELTHDAPDHLSMEGSGGYVTASLAREGSKTTIELETREWEEQVRRFAEEVT